MKTKDAARGKWRGILIACGADSKVLVDKHGPCPFCGGRDRFRFDNRDGDGSFICSNCGAGDGFEFLKRLRGWGFVEAASEVDRVLGNIQADPIKPRIDEDTRRRLLNDLWVSAVPIVSSDPAGMYLARRGLTQPVSTALRFASQCPLVGQGRGPAMIALVMNAEGRPATIHRTFLTTCGHKVSGNARAMMPGEIPDGCAVRLSPAGKTLGIAEGIETALAASRQFGIPVWAALNATMMSKWLAPEGVEEVVVFGDNDESFTGQAAAFSLAHKLARKINVRVEIPDRIGTDWADKIAA